MRILILADIHANWTALQAVQEPHDLCIFLGDLVDYGLEPTPCIDWVRKNAKLTVRGNHDHGAAQNVVINSQSGFKYLTSVTRPLTRQMISAEERRFLMDLPVTRWATVENQRFFMCHATPRDPLDEYAPPDPEFWGRRLEHIDADVICVGHTHMPYVVEVGKKLVINPGSIGLPRDGNPKASYAVMENGQVELKRIDYPIETAVAVVQQSSLPAPAKDMLIEVYRTGEAKHHRVDTRVSKGRPSSQGTDTGFIRPPTEAIVPEIKPVPPAAVPPAEDPAEAPRPDTRPMLPPFK